MLSTLPSSSSHHHSHPLYSPSFCAKIHCPPSQKFISAPSNPLSPTDLTLPSHSPLTCLHTIPHSYTLITCSPTYYTKFTQLQLPAIPDTITLHCNRNTPKHTQGPQKPAAPATTSPTHPPHFPLPLLVPPYSTPQISIASLTNVNPSNSTAYRYYHKEVFYIIYKLIGQVLYL
jgi:hypothetical protein